jgi:hypothetical protein
MRVSVCDAVAVRLAVIVGPGMLFVTLTGTAALAQGSTSAPVPAASASAERSHEPTRVYVGMWTLHLKHDVVALDNNWLVGVSHRGYFGATFLNSFGRRAYAAGVQRTLVSSARGPLTAALGVRLGAITGYDGRFMRLARHTPVLPLISAFVNVDVGRAGVEVAYTMVVVSAAVSIRLGR